MHVLTLCLYRVEKPEGGGEHFLQVKVLVTSPSLFYVDPWPLLNTKLQRNERQISVPKPISHQAPYFKFSLA